MNLDDIIIVLARPGEAGNVGAVCRGMKNMGLSRLRLAAPAFDEGDGPALSEAGLSYGGAEAVIRARAVHGTDIWEKARRFDTLTEAVADCSLVVGATRRRGRRRKQTTMTAGETAAFLRERPGPAALVFGNERTGLDDRELELCGLASHIPAEEAFPSLNLSHAVMIYAYELRRSFGPGTDGGEPAAVKGQWVALNQGEVESLVREMTDNLQKLGFYKHRGREEQERFFRDIFTRAGITRQEGRYFADTITKAARMEGIPV